MITFEGEMPTCPVCGDSDNWYVEERDALEGHYPLRCVCGCCFLWKPVGTSLKVAPEIIRKKSKQFLKNSPSQSDFAKQGTVISLGNARYPRWGIYLGAIKGFPFEKGQRVEVAVKPGRGF